MSQLKLRVGASQFTVTLNSTPEQLREAYAFLLMARWLLEGIDWFTIGYVNSGTARYYYQYINCWWRWSFPDGKLPMYQTRDKHEVLLCREWFAGRGQWQPNAWDSVQQLVHEIIKRGKGIKKTSTVFTVLLSVLANEFTWQQGQCVAANSETAMILKSLDPPTQLHRFYSDSQIEQSRRLLHLLSAHDPNESPSVRQHCQQLQDLLTVMLAVNALLSENLSDPQADFGVKLFD